jgi:uncharacterized protein (DUF1778 family)
MAHKANPVPKTQVCAQVPTELRQRLVKAAEVSGQSISSIIVRALVTAGI